MRAPLRSFAGQGSGAVAAERRGAFGLSARRDVAEAGDAPDCLTCPPGLIISSSSTYLLTYLLSYYYSARTGTSPEGLLQVDAEKQ
jgi:hypothetical protein